MGIVSVLKSLLGIESSRSHREQTIDSPVRTDEEDIVETEAAAERAVKEPVESAEAEIGDESSEAEPVDVIKGIGPAYSERLAAAGIETVDELAAADVEELAEVTGIGDSRLGNWIEQANAR